MVMCAHRFEPKDLMGWHTHEPDAVIRGIVQESAAVVVSQVLGLTHATRRETAAPSPLEPASEFQEWLSADSSSTKQKTLLTDGGTSASETKSSLPFWCPWCEAVITLDGEPATEWAEAYWHSYDHQDKGLYAVVVTDQFQRVETIETEQHHV
ncbi:hypothetical protein C5B91_20035 [Haloferax sp. Atlit-10N]|nr:hypothetical protein C5B87_19295 [Haloferax sp. Atlit-16N]RDZ53904.1 hypothetical protein C5B91_20035 [Haloferax sp. Atlit-10N]